MLLVRGSMRFLVVHLAIWTGFPYLRVFVPHACTCDAGTLHDDSGDVPQVRLQDGGPAGTFIVQGAVEPRKKKIPPNPNFP